MSKYLEFSEVAVGFGATRRWNVKSTHGAELGLVKWHSPWRRYVFHPLACTLLDAACMVELSKFLEDKTREQQEDARARREARRSA
jgi:hypothetical protein